MEGKKKIHSPHSAESKFQTSAEANMRHRRSRRTNLKSREFLRKQSLGIAWRRDLSTASSTLIQTETISTTIGCNLITCGPDIHGPQRMMMRMILVIVANWHQGPKLKCVLRNAHVSLISHSCRGYVEFSANQKMLTCYANMNANVQKSKHGKRCAC